MKVRPPDGIWPSSGARRPPPPLDVSRKLGDLLPRLWSEVCRAAPPWKARLAECWPQIVGPRYAPHLRPGAMEGFKGRTMIVFVDHPVIQFEAERGLRDLPARIRATVPEAPVDRVLFRSDPGAEPEAAGGDGDGGGRGEVRGRA